MHLSPESNWELVPLKKGLEVKGSASHSTFNYPSTTSKPEGKGESALLG